MLRQSLLIASLVLSTTAFGQSVGERTGVNSTLGIAPKTEDFIKEAAMSDMTEIEAGKIAVAQGPASQKSFAQSMIDAHTKTSATLKAAVADQKISSPIPATLDDGHKSKIDSLRTSKNFGSDYKSMQVSAHKDAVSLFERYSNGGENSSLKAWAAKTLPDLKHHLEMANSLATQ